MTVAMSRTHQAKTLAAPHTAAVSGAEKTKVNGAHVPRKFSKEARFDNSKDAADFVAKEYIPGLTKFKEDFAVKNPDREITDQDFPVELIRMVPPFPKYPPLLIVGGMGPLAGAQAFDEALTTFKDALQQFGDTREIVLLQLCDVPDRTDALDADAALGGRSDLHEQVVAKMAEGLVGAEVNALETTSRFGMAHVVVACNTAHNFVPEAFDAYQQQRVQNGQLKLDSMVECVTAELKKSEAGKESPPAYPRHQRHTQDEAVHRPAREERCQVCGA